ncbi:hypothetical protein B0H13DRAFT_1986350 [Mycena leptocephala]|nr:hypothetical protein B0H13DRAFT_1986350 [Mycena leptocephala]
MRLASVCRDWRNIVFLTPQMWSLMTVCLNPITQTTDLERRFSLSKDCPLSLDLFYNRPYFTRLGTSSPRPLEVATRHCRNWETVKIDLMDRDSATLDQVKGSLPLLRQLHVSSYGESIGDAFSEAPRLRDLEVTIINTSARALSSTNFPWSHLTTFRGDGLSVEDCFKVFQFAPHLEACTFSGWFGADDGLPTAPLTLPSLRSLSLMNHEQFGWFLGALNLPRLDNLQLSMLARQIPSFCDFISRSSCSLKKLGMKTSSLLSYEDLLKLWDAVPTVTQINVSPSTFSDQMIRLLLEKRHVLPNLEDIIVDGKGLYNSIMDYQLLLDFLRSRQRPDATGSISSLRSFNLLATDNWDNWDISPDVIFQLKTIAKEGMDIQIDVTVPLSALVSGQSRF